MSLPIPSAMSSTQAKQSRKASPRSKMADLKALEALRLRADSGDKLLTSTQVANLCGAGHQTVKDWRVAGKLKPAAKDGAWYLYSSADLAAILRTAIGGGYADALLSASKRKGKAAKKK